MILLGSSAGIQVAECLTFLPPAVLRSFGSSSTKPIETTLMHLPVHHLNFPFISCPLIEFSMALRIGVTCI